jgi:hypothetical protein
LLIGVTPSVMFNWYAACTAGIDNMPIRPVTTNEKRRVSLLDIILNSLESTAAICFGRQRSVYRHIKTKTPLENCIQQALKSNANYTVFQLKG